MTDTGGRTCKPQTLLILWEKANDNWQMEFVCHSPGHMEIKLRRRVSLIQVFAGEPSVIYTQAQSNYTMERKWIAGVMVHCSGLSHGPKVQRKFPLVLQQAWKISLKSKHRCRVFFKDAFPLVCFLVAVDISRLRTATIFVSRVFVKTRWDSFHAIMPSGRSIRPKL